MAVFVTILCSTGYKNKPSKTHYYQPPLTVVQQTCTSNISSNKGNYFHILFISLVFIYTEVKLDDKKTINIKVKPGLVNV